MEKKMNARKKAQRAARLRKQRNRRIALTLCLMFVVAFASIGGTIAWLTAKSTTVTNIFTASDINIKLEETVPADKTAKMVPGNTIAKDPKVTVEGGSEDCWLFVKIEKSTNYSTYLHNYTVANGWTPLPDNDGVYYRTVAASDSDQPFYVLSGVTHENGEVIVKDTVTKANMEALTDATNPTLTFTAYAIQSANLDVTADRTITNIYEMAVAGTTAA